MKNATLMLAVVATLLALPTASLGQSPAGQNPAEVARGAELYGQICGRCHNLRAATERTDREWVTIMFHMRVRANLSRSQSDAILAFLQATNLPEGSPPATAYNPALPPQGKAQPHQQATNEPQTVKREKKTKPNKGEKNDN